MWNYESKNKDTCCCQMSLISSKKRSRNFYEWLELLQNTNDTQLLSTIFSTLGIYILSKNVGDEIIKCEPLYEKMYFVLNCGLQAQITITLNFISALLHFEEDGLTRKWTLYIYTQNMLRSSGCLTAMSNLLTSFMLYQETLKALCLSISEAVRDSPVNQSFCSHLVPLCIQKCREGCWETFLVLQSLLNKHNHNVQFFHECKGMTIFTRDRLQNTLCLQLINTVLENSNTEYKQNIINSSRIFEHLLHYLQKYGCSTPVIVFAIEFFNELLKVGQWASIILYSYQKVFKININMKSLLENSNKDKPKHKTCSKTVQSVTKERLTSPKLDETNELFQNILNEIILSQRQRPFPHDSNKTSIKCTPNIQYLKNQTGNVYKNTEHSKKQRKSSPQDNSLSFSFLLKEISPQNGIYNQPSNISKSFLDNQDSAENSRKLNKYSEILKQNVTLNNDKTFLENGGNNSVIDFKPHFVSTPKKASFDHNTISQMSMPTSSSVTTRSREPSQSLMYRTKRMHKISKSKQKTLQNKSLTAKILNIVNASCTTIVNSFYTFKNIFKGNKVSEVSETNDSMVEVNTSCSYSFTKYMRKRDAILMKNNKKITAENESFASFKTVAKNCNTCNDTIALKQKLVNNESLQQTIKKLKMGINLYGCDFKKISKNMWPNENYMTPTVLYNLYRKLIIK